MDGCTEDPGGRTLAPTPASTDVNVGVSSHALVIVLRDVRQATLDGTAVGERCGVFIRTCTSAIDGAPVREVFGSNCGKSSDSLVSASVSV